MPIDHRALAAPENRYLHLPGELSLREAFCRLLAPGRKGQPWWHLVVSRADGTWAVERFGRLYERVQEDRQLPDLSLEHADVLLAATAVEQGSMGTAAARRLALKSPGKLVVVTRDGHLAGILCTPTLASGGPSMKDFQKMAADAAPVPGAGPVRRTVRRYTDVSCPDRVALETPRFSVVVRLTVERSPHDATSRELEVALQHPVRVELLRASGFKLLTDAIQEIRPLADRDSAPAAFDLRPLWAGHHRLELEFLQETAPLGVVSIPVEVSRNRRPFRSRKKSLDFPFPSPGISPPDLVLRVRWDQASRSLLFSLLRGGGAGWDEFEPVALTEEPAAYSARLFGRLTELTGAAADTPSDSAPSAPNRAVQEELRAKGQYLWEKIVPEGLQALYGEEREDWRDRSLLIHSDEPYIPWELIWPWDVRGLRWQDKEPWCLSLRLARWLRRDSRANGNAGAPGLLPLGTLACLASTDHSLPHAIAERDFLRDLARRHGITDLSPVQFTRHSLLDLLRSGESDWLHFATHCSFSAEAPDQGSALRLGDLTHLTPEDMVGIEIAGPLRQKRPAFVLNGCETGRRAWGPVGLGGWADRLIGLGAGMFLGTLWPVRDVSARSLIEAFYGRLLEGEPVAEALRQARLASCTEYPADPSWLAYSLYAHPNARCEVRQLP